MRLLLGLSVMVLVCGIPQKVPFEPPSVVPVEPKSDGQHLVKHCLKGNAGVWQAEEVLSYCLSLVTSND